MTYRKALNETLGVRWKIKTCVTGESCWCRMIVPEEPILYDDAGVQDEISICPSGALDKEVAEHIVLIHNSYLPH
jgi:hypothetical protein